MITLARLIIDYTHFNIFISNILAYIINLKLNNVLKYHYDLH